MEVNGPDPEALMESLPTVDEEARRSGGAAGRALYRARDEGRHGVRGVA